MRVLKYTLLAILLHWLMALLILGNGVLGHYVEDLPFSPQKLQLIAYHKWVGITLLMLLAVRLLWRFMATPPALPDTIPRWQQRAAAATHGLLYLLMLAIPISGWLMSSAKGVPVVWFEVWTLPDLLAKDKALGDLLENIHKALNLSLILLLCMHIGAALKHQFIDKDAVLARMLPFIHRGKKHE